MVAPERDTPGTSASAWKQPMIRPSRRVISDSSRSRRETASARSITKEKRMSAEPTSSSVRNSSSIGFLKASPRTAIGIVPRMMYQPRRASGSCGARSRASARAQPRRGDAPQVAAEVESTAASVPSWTTAVKAAPGSSQPKKAGMMRRWAVLETGRNSVSPCTIPRTMA